MTEDFQPARGSGRRKGVPLWAFGIAILAALAWGAFLPMPILAAVGIGAILLFLFRERFDAGLSVWIMLALVGAMLFGVAVGKIGRGVTGLAREISEQQAEQARADKAMAEMEKTAKAFVASLSDPKDKALARDVFERLMLKIPPVIRTRDIQMVQSAHGRAVCGEVSPNPTGKMKGLAGFLEDDFLVVLVERDGFDEATRAVCRPLVLKYLDEPGVNADEANAAFAASGCQALDAEYWIGWKQYCAKAPKPSKASGGA